jgi:hypothetical protein
VEAGHPLAAALDERSPADEEERDVAAESRGDLDAIFVAELRGRAPGLERRIDRRRRVAAATGQARGDGDPLLEAGSERLGVDPRPRKRGARRGNGAEDEVVGRGSGVESAAPPLLLA